MTIIIILLGYLIGSLSFAIVTTRLLSLEDPRTYGSQNPGATNVLRSGNKLAAFLTLLGDAGKAVVAMLLAQWAVKLWGLNPDVVAWTGVAALVGHVLPLWHHFRGGKGVATGLGVLLMLDWRLGLMVAFVWVTCFLITRVSSLSALVASIGAPIISWVWLGNGMTTYLIALIAIILIIRHKSNITNLMSGQEPMFKR